MKEDIEILLYCVEGITAIMCIVMVCLVVRYIKRSSRYEKELNDWRNSIRVEEEVMTPGGELGTVTEIEGVFRRVPRDSSDKEKDNNFVTVTYKTTRDRLWKPGLKTPEL